MAPGRVIVRSGELARATGLTLRQIQWWCEHRLLIPRMEGHVRLFDDEHVRRAFLIVELRKKGVILKGIRITLGQLANTTERYIAVGTNNRCLFASDSADETIRAIQQWKCPAIVIDRARAPRSMTA